MEKSTALQALSVCKHNCLLGGNLTAMSKFPADAGLSDVYGSLTNNKSYKTINPFTSKPLKGHIDPLHQFNKLQMFPVTFYMVFSSPSCSKEKAYG